VHDVWVGGQFEQVCEDARPREKLKVPLKQIFWELMVHLSYSLDQTLSWSQRLHPASFIGFQVGILTFVKILLTGLGVGVSFLNVLDEY
jgi:hypothetical protein